jgi:Ni/Co efflux regulator RcnB
MNKTCKLLALTLVATTVSAPIAFAQGHDDHHDNHAYVHHKDWKKGRPMNHDDWNRGERVDYHEHHLAAPRAGYEWREVDGNYVEAAVATGVIATIIAASAGH